LAILGLLDAKREYRDERAKSWTIPEIRIGGFGGI